MVDIGKISVVERLGINMINKHEKEVKTVLNNIRILAKIKGIKIGDLERQNGLTVGYFSRGLNVKLSTVIGVSRQLGVTVDDLINKDYNSILIDSKIRELKNKRDELTSEIKNLESQKEGLNI